MYRKRAMSYMCSKRDNKVNCNIFGQIKRELSVRDHTNFRLRFYHEISLIQINTSVIKLLALARDLTQK